MALRALTLGAVVAGSSSLQAQHAGWQPSRVPDKLTAQPLHKPASGLPPKISSVDTAQAYERDDILVLRWKKPAKHPQAGEMQSTAGDMGMTPPNRSGAQQAFQQTQTVSARSVFENPAVRAASYDEPRRLPDTAVNPLRKQPDVRPANYQQDVAGVADPFSEAAPAPQLPKFEALQDSLPTLPGAQEGDSNTPLLPGLADPLATPQAAPIPNFEADQSNPPNPFPRPAPQDISPLDRNLAVPDGGSPSNSRPDRRELDAPLRPDPDASTRSCNDLRNRPREIPISSISLDVSPSYGEGRSTMQDNEMAQAEFAASAEVRQWSDSKGRPLSSGRMVDLRDDSVILDIDGSKRSIPLRSLSDADLAYVGKSWNIPLTCGTGFEPFEGRNFIASTVQWTASGLCHKPLYFEQVQLERYGHEAGPLLQPLLSTAHFFGNIAIAPYKMGIHPPNECQYALGYIRPGNCAPYMMQPFPWSLRGAAVQATVVTGAAALIP